MINHDSIILMNLKNNKNYSLLTKDGIIKKEKFQPKQFEYLCLGCYENFMKSFYSDDNFQVRLLDFDSINGLAFKYEKTNYSLIHWGTISSTYEFALKLTEDSNFFPDTFLDKRWRTINNNDISPKDKALETRYRKIYPCGTNDQARRDLAYLLSNFAWTSTIFHEAGHILNGHLDYLRQAFNEDSLSIFYDDISDEKYISRKTLEKDADEFAGNRIIENSFENDYYFKFYRNIVYDEKELIRIITTGVTLKFLLYGIKSNWNSKLYLPNGYRIINILDAGLAMLKNKKYFIISVEDYHKVIIESIRSALVAFNNRFPERKIDINVFLEQLLSGQEENKILEKKWNEIRSILNDYKHKMVELPALF